MSRVLSRKARFIARWTLVVIIGYLIYQNPIVQGFFYPFPHREIITENAQRFGVDPLLVAAIIRVESKFSPRAESQVGAKGLMQLMPETAQWVAEQMGVSDYTTQSLYEPEQNIRIGCWYLGNLMEEFQGNTVLVLAAYNGGRGNVRQWLDNHQWTGELGDLERIPFPETRDYVRQVIRDSAYTIVSTVKL